MKYKVGDKVVIKANLDDVVNVNPKMKKYCGKTMTIREFTGASYKMQEDSTEHMGSGWYWSEDMISHNAIPKYNFNVGDVVKLVENPVYTMGLRPMDLKKYCAGLMEIVRVDENDNAVVVDTAYGKWHLEPKVLKLVARGIIKEEPKTPEKPSKHKWTETEIQRADAIAKEILIDLYDKNISPVFYINKVSIDVTCGFGYPSLEKTATAKCFEGDEFNEKIGKCVALCKLVGKKIPNFILNHDDPKSDKEELIEKLKSQGYNWIARDEDGQLCVFDEKPSVLYNFWGRYGKNKTLSSNFFNDVTWRGGPVKL